MKELQDHELIERSIKGDDQAFGEIVKRYQSLVATIAMNMLADPDDAQDVGQETFIRLHSALKKFRGESSLKTYLSRICMNLSLNKLKRRKTWRDRSFSLESHQVLSLHKEESSFEDRLLVHMALSQLKPQARSVVVLRMIQSYSTKEAAQILKIPEGTVLSRLKRAMEELKRIIEKELKYEQH